MTDLVPIARGKSVKVSLGDIQDRLDARKQVEETRSPAVSTKKSRMEAAERAFKTSPVETLLNLQAHAEALAVVFDGSINLASVPLSQAQVNKLSQEFFQLEKLQAQISAMESRYRELIFAHLDETGPKIPGRPPAQVPGKVEAEGPGPRYVFERRGGNRSDPDLNVESLREVLPEELVSQIYKTVHHPAVHANAWDEEVFDQDRFGELVDKGDIDLDVVAEHLTPGSWRKPSFYKTLMDGGEG